MDGWTLYKKHWGWYTLGSRKSWYTYPSSPLPLIHLLVTRLLALTIAHNDHSSITTTPHTLHIQPSLSHHYDIAIITSLTTPTGLIILRVFAIGIPFAGLLVAMFAEILQSMLAPGPFIAGCHAVRETEPNFK